MTSAVPSRRRVRVVTSGFSLATLLLLAFVVFSQRGEPTSPASRPSAGRASTVSPVSFPPRPVGAVAAARAKAAVIPSRGFDGSMSPAAWAAEADGTQARIAAQLKQGFAADSPSWDAPVAVPTASR